MKTSSSQDAVIVALVDDHPGVRRSLQLILHLNGFACRVYASAEGFLNSADIDDVSCLVLDVRMPGMSGLDLQRQLVADSRHVPIVLVTAYPDPEIEAEARRAGASGFVAKSRASEDLVPAITLALGIGTARDVRRPALA